MTQYLKKSSGMPKIEPGPLDESKYAISVLRSHQIVLALFHWIELDDKVQNINAEKINPASFPLFRFRIYC